MQTTFQLTIPVASTADTSLTASTTTQSLTTTPPTTISTMVHYSTTVATAVQEKAILSIQWIDQPPMR